MQRELSIPFSTTYGVEVEHTRMTDSESKITQVHHLVRVFLFSRLSNPLNVVTGKMIQPFSGNGMRACRPESQVTNYSEQSL